jgi:hypothetical protein
VPHDEALKEPAVQGVTGCASQSIGTRC